MPQYAIHDERGTIDRIVDLPELDIEHQLAEGELYTEVDKTTEPWDRIDVSARTIIKVDPATVDPPRVLTVEDQRVQSYPSIGEQLDMLWHAMDRGEIPKAAAFYNRILAVKQALPHNVAAPIEVVDVVTKKE